MIKFKHLFYFVLISILLYSCSSNTSNINNFDHEKQAEKDRDTIIKFLKSHYYKDAVDSIKPLIAGETALFTDSRLKSNIVNEYDLDYTYYYFVKKQGISNKKKTTVVDSVFTTYRLSSVIKSNSLISEKSIKMPVWYNTVQQTKGWAYGFTHFKGGTLKKNDDGSPINAPDSYDNTGKGFFLLPSGLAYRNTTSGGGLGLANKNLLYIVDLKDIVEDTDHDSDNVPSILEDIDGDGKPYNDDSDSDRIPNYLDVDDDGDGKLTKNEVDKEGGNPLNNFSDPSKPSTPDFLNRNIFK